MTPFLSSLDNVARAKYSQKRGTAGVIPAGGERSGTPSHLELFVLEGGLADVAKCPGQESGTELIQIGVSPVRGDPDHCM